jgi:transcription-repair coupling factor (superfamily II helicase)
MVPEARVCYAHGKMNKYELEDIITDFIDHKYDVLVSTTIIETGIDIPNANTIIIERADTLGLSQIYQIRGRVGRSDRMAYAYLMYDKDRVLTETGKKRLETIKEFTTLGSGYKIAMRDLSIRGAGDILGSEQSGFIDDIGINLYMKLLNEAIEEEKGIIKEQEKEKVVDLKISKHIDENYISDDEIRIAMHQEISKVKSREELNRLIAEFSDRYGRVNDELKIYVEGKYLTFLLKTKGVEVYAVKKESVNFNFDVEKTRKIPYTLIKAAAIGVPEYKFKLQDNRIYVEIPLNLNNNNLDSNHYIFKLTKFLENF